MDQRLLDYADGNKPGIASGVDATDPWIIEVLLDTLAVALHLPLRLVITPRLEAAYDRQAPLGKAIAEHFGDLSGFKREAAALVADARSGLDKFREEPAWEIVGEVLFKARAILTSNSDPFWTVMRGLQYLNDWELFWLVTQIGGAESIAGLPQPFGDDFMVCADGKLPFGLRLVAGPVWRWKPGNCDEPGVASNGVQVAERIVRALSAHISHHQARKARDEEVGSFTPERLLRSVVNRPPMLAADLRRRVRLAASALEHALNVRTDRLPRVNELVAIAVAALHIAGLREAMPPPAGEIEYWHRLEVGWDEAPHDNPWLVTTFFPNGPTSGNMAPGPPPAQHDGRRVLTIDPDSAADEVIAFGHLMVDYAVGRSAYIRERMIIIRLWLRDNFARWLTTPNVQKDDNYKLRVDDLAWRIADIFVADRCSVFRYDAETRTLDRLGRFSRDQSNEDEIRRVNYDDIRAAGTDAARRADSPAYRAIDKAKAIHVPEYFGNIGQAAGQACAVLAVPIQVLGRPWGAIELVGLRPYQFLDSTKSWLDEVGRILGPDLYVEAVLNDLHEISRTVLADQPKQKQLRAVLGFLARIFVASSGALYLQHPRRTAEFECVAFFGRVPDRADGKLSGFNISDKISKAAVILRDEKKIWEAGEIGKPPFDGEWASRQKTKDLLNGGHKYIAMMPLHDASDKLIGCITLTAREEGPYEGRFRYLAEFATRYAGVAIDAIKIKHRPDETAREQMAHSLKTRVHRVAAVADSLEQLLAGFFGHAGEAQRVTPLLRELENVTRHRWSASPASRADLDLLHDMQRAFDHKSQSSFATLLGDLQEQSVNLRNTAEVLAGDPNNSEHPYFTKQVNWTGTPTALRDCLLGCVKPVARMRNADIQVPPPQQLGAELRVRVPSLIMSDIINNFCDNAIKYRTPGTAALIRFLRLNENAPASLEFRNLAPRLSDEDAVILGRQVFRSDYAKDRSSEGQGRGLLSNRRLSERWRMRLIHRQEPTDLKSGEVWHVFGLEIPADLIFEDAIERSTERFRRP